MCTSFSHSLLSCRAHECPSLYISACLVARTALCTGKVQRRMRQNFLWEICHLSAADKSQVAEDAAGVALNDIKESLESLGGFGESLGSSIPSL